MSNSRKPKKGDRPKVWYENEAALANDNQNKKECIQGPGHRGGGGGEVLNFLQTNKIINAF